MVTKTGISGYLPSGEEALLFEFTNDKGTVIKITNYGCTVLSVQVKDKYGNLDDIVTGYDSWEEWLENPYYFGCIVGRTCNRISNARFILNGIEYKLAANQGIHNLHGGILGFHKKLWKTKIIENRDRARLEMEYLSMDGEEGFPGNLHVKVTYTFTDSNLFLMEMEAVSDKASPINLTNHTYFNLRGQQSENIYEQEFLILADSITETDQDLIPTGQLKPVAGTPFDFTYVHAVGERIHELPMGYDDNFVLKNYNGELNTAFVARDPKSGRALEVMTTEPGMQLYTSNWFDSSQKGKNQVYYKKHCAFAVETQHFPDSVNRPEFPSVILQPGEKYSSATSWRFFIKE